MTRRIVEVQDRTYTVSPDDEIPLAERTWAVVSARVVDEMTLEPLRSAMTIKTDDPGLTPRVASNGLAGLVGMPGRVFPNLAAQSYQINMTIMAKRYVPRQVNVTIAQDMDFPDAFDPAEIDVPMHREPVIIKGRTVLANAATTTPIPGTTVSIAGIWRTFPPANMVVPADPPNLVALEPPLYLARAAATGRLRRREMIPVVAEDKFLLDQVNKGANLLRLSDRVNLSSGDIILIDVANPDFMEYLTIDTVSGASTADRPANITLTHAVAYSHNNNVVVQKVTPQGPGSDNQFAQDAIAGDISVFLASMNDLDSASVVEISGGGAPTTEYHSMGRFSVTSNADGYFRLPLLSRVAQLEIEADDGGVHPRITQIFSPDYTLRENRIDFGFR